MDEVDEVDEVDAMDEVDNKKGSNHGLCHGIAALNRALFYSQSFSG